MAFTTHGYQIPGTAVVPPRPPVARCGGPKLCAKCATEVRLWGEQPLIPMVFDTNNDGQPDIFLDKVKTLVTETYNRHILDIVDTPLLHEDEVYIVSFSKVLQNWKALASTDRSDGRYYELTYDGEKGQTYVDTYVRVQNETIQDNER